MSSTLAHRFSVVVALLLLLWTFDATADVSLFGNYYDNIGRMTAANAPATVAKLISDGHNPDETDDSGRSGLLIAATDGNLLIAGMLIKAGAHLGFKDRLGNTPLHYAVERNHEDVVQQLLDAGASVDAENTNGTTPLMMAATHGYASIAQDLLAKGANPRKADFTGRDAINWAQDSRHEAVARMLQRTSQR